MPASPRVRQLGQHFTMADIAALNLWITDDSHGYDRLQVERCVLEAATWASYALIYRPGLAWATWGLTRQGRQIETWSCATGKALGRHDHALDALDELPHATHHPLAAPAKAARVHRKRSR